MCFWIISTISSTINFINNLKEPSYNDCALFSKQEPRTADRYLLKAAKCQWKWKQQQHICCALINKLSDKYLMLHCICLAIREDSSKDEFCPRDKNKGNSCVCSVGEIPHKFCLNYHYYSWLGGPAVESHSFLCLFPTYLRTHLSTTLLVRYYFLMSNTLCGEISGWCCVSVGVRSTVVLQLWWWIDGAGEQLFLIMRIVSIETCGFPLSPTQSFPILVVVDGFRSR